MKTTINHDAPMCEQTIHRGDMSIPAIDDIVSQAGHSSAVQFVNDSALWNVLLSEVVAMLEKDIEEDDGDDPDACSAAPLSAREQDAAGDRYFADRRGL